MISLPVIFSNYSPRKDKSVLLKFETQELNDETVKELWNLSDKYGYLVFKETPIQKEDIPKDDTLEFDEQKTPGQRLRAVFYRIWEQQGSQGDFNGWYRTQMNKLIEFYKEKLD